MIISKDGNVLSIQGDPIPQRLFTDLDHELSYTYRSRNFRGDLLLEKRLLYNMSCDNLMLTTIGMWPDIQKVLAQHPNEPISFVNIFQ